MTLGAQLCRAAIRRASSSAATVDVTRFFNGPHIPNSSSFLFYPHFFDEKEQKVLLTSCLKKLDSAESRRARKRRALIQPPSLPSPAESSSGVSELFRPDNMYEFQEGHFDGVISNFREMHVTSWPAEDYASLSPLLDRLRRLIPDVQTQTHILHLSTEGQIFPHVDNLDASGSWILGVSLGSPRVLRLEKSGDGNKSFDVLLPSGSIYLQRDSLRFDYKHSILKNEQFGGEMPTGGQRVSIMIRDIKLENRC